MFKLSISTLLFFVSIYCIAQGKYLHIPEATVQSANDDLKIFTSDRYTILYGVHEHLKEKKDAKQHTITWIENASRRTSKVVIDPVGDKNPNFFGFHLKENMFSFFEDIYDSEKEAYTLILHTFYPGRDKIVQKRVISETAKTRSINYRYAHVDHGKFSALAALNQNKSGQQSISITVFSRDHEVMSRQHYLFSEKLNNSFDWTLNLNSRGQLLAVFQIKGEKGLDYLAYTSVNVLEEAKDRLTFTPLYSDKGLQMNDFKVFLDDNGVVEFMGVYSQKSQKGVSNKIMFRNLLLEKDSLLLDNVFDLDNGKDLKLDTYLAMNDTYSIVMFNEREPNQINTSASKTSAKNEPASEKHGNKQTLVIYYINNQKGVIWQNKNELTVPESVIRQQNLHHQAFKNYAWSDGTKLYIYFNGLATENQSPSTVSAEFSSQGSRGAISKWYPMLKAYDLLEGKSSSIALPINSRDQILYGLTGMSSITPMKYLISLVQTESNTFYPIQLFIQNL